MPAKNAVRRDARSAEQLQSDHGMPKKSTIEKARRDARQGKAPTTQAGEFVHEEIDHIREGKHGARSTRQAIAIGLSKARRAGVKLPAPKPGTTSERTRRKAEKDVAVGQGRRRPRAPSPKRARATERALKRESTQAASSEALSRQAKRAAATRRKRGGVTASGATRTPRTTRGRAGSKRRSAGR
jgi:hypothetical protein